MTIFDPFFGGSWSRLGAVLGPKMDPVTPKFPPKPNPIGVLGRLEGSLERPKSVLVRFKAASSFAHEKRWKIDLVLVPWNMIILQNCIGFSVVWGCHGFQHHYPSKIDVGPNLAPFWGSWGVLGGSWALLGGS